MALYSLFKITVLCALFQAAAAEAPCTTSCCHDKPATCDGSLSTNPPVGTYSAYHVPTPWHGSVSHVELVFYPAGTTYLDAHDKPVVTGGAYVLYQLNVIGCLFSIVNGVFENDCTGPPTHMNPIKNYTGHWVDNPNGKGSFLKPVAFPGGTFGDTVKDTWIEIAINKLFGTNGIHWCPTPGQFVIKAFGIGTSEKSYCTLTQPKFMYAAVPPYADTSE